MSINPFLHDARASIRGPNLYIQVKYMFDCRSNFVTDVLCIVCTNYFSTL